MKKYSTPIRLISIDRNGIECISRLISGVQNSHGILVPSIGVNRLFVATDVRIDFSTSSIRAYPRTNAISHVSLFEMPATPRACCLRTASSPLHVARRRRRQSAGTPRHTQREAGDSAGGAPGGATGWPASPSPGGCNLLLRDPATYVGAFFLPLLCVLLPSLFSWRGTLFRVVPHTRVCRHYKSVFPGFTWKRGHRVLRFKSENWNFAKRGVEEGDMETDGLRWNEQWHPILSRIAANVKLYRIHRIFSNDIL